MRGRNSSLSSKENTRSYSKMRRTGWKRETASLIRATLSTRREIRETGHPKSSGSSHPPHSRGRGLSRSEFLSHPPKDEVSLVLQKHDGKRAPVRRFCDQRGEPTTFLYLHTLVLRCSNTRFAGGQIGVVIGVEVSVDKHKLLC